MAYTKIHAIKATVHKAITYICNPDKTDENILISSFGCSPETAQYDFKFALSKTRQSDENKAFHLIQSFLPGEVTYEEAHRIGTELADKLLEGKYSYVVSTHIDKGHVHNHLIFCAADNIEHKKYNDCKRSYYHIRHLSDDLCKEHNLSVITPDKNKSKSYKEWQDEKFSATDIPAIKKDINAMIKAASTYEEFIALMRAKGYEITGETFEENARKYISFRPMGRERAVRGSARSLGTEYTKEDIKKRILSKSKKRLPFPQKNTSNKKLIDTSQEKFQNSPGLKHWADIQNLKAAANAYANVENLTALEEKIASSTTIANTAKASLVELEKRMKTLAEIIKYAEQYQENLPYNLRYKKSPNPDAYFRKHEAQLILFDGAKHMLQSFGLSSNSVNLQKLKVSCQKLECKHSDVKKIYVSAFSDLTKLKNSYKNITRYLSNNIAKNPTIENLIL